MSKKDSSGKVVTAKSGSMSNAEMASFLKGGEQPADTTAPPDTAQPATGVFMVDVGTPGKPSVPQQPYDSRRDGYLYVGTRDESGVKVVVHGEGDLNARLDRRHHAEEFAWGEASPGAAQLAFAMLFHASGPQDADIGYHEFKRTVVSRFKKEGFHITQREVRQKIGRSFLS